MATNEEVQALRDKLAKQVGQNGICAVGLEKDPHSNGFIVGVSVDDATTQQRIQQEFEKLPVAVHVTGPFRSQ